MGGHERGGRGVRVQARRVEGGLQVVLLGASRWGGKQPGVPLPHGTSAEGGCHRNRNVATIIPFSVQLSFFGLTEHKGLKTLAPSTD